MKAQYDAQPSKFEDIKNGSIVYRYNITEEQSPSGDASAKTHWTCDEVYVWQQVTSSKVVSAVISDRWEANHEQKLVNEYYSAVLGIIEGEEADAAIAAYKTFLVERRALKASVEADCAEAGIVND